MKLKDKVIVALDKPDLEDVDRLLDQLKGSASYFKIGFELFTAQGWKAVERVRRHGGRIFLDLKLHDIPNTVARAIRVVCEHEIDMVNVHTLGGMEMMQAAAEAARSYKKAPVLIGVTILTSHTEAVLRQELGMSRSLPDQVLHLARQAHEAGLNGLVCSPLEVTMLRQEIARPFCLVTPGIRPAGSAAGDQKRICTPREAFEKGADYLVIGRPVTDAPDPGEAFDRIAATLEGLQTP